MRKSLASLIGHWLPVIAWGAFIFYWSSLPNLGTDLGLVDWFLRKLAHIGEYFLLTYLVFRALAPGPDAGNTRWKRALMGAATLAFVYAISDEFHQSFVAGRQGTVRDVLIDGLGIAGAFFVVWRRRRAGCR